MDNHEVRQDKQPLKELPPPCPKCGSEIKWGFGLRGLSEPWAFCTNEKCDWRG